MQTTDNYFKRIEPFKEEFGALLAEAMKEGLSKVADLVSSQQYIGTYYDWPSISFRKNGLPDLSSSFQEPKDYRNCFGEDANKIKESDIISFNNFLTFVTSNEDLENRFIMSQSTEVSTFAEFRTILITSTIKNAIERYIHKFDEFVYSDDKATAIIQEITNYIFSDTLSIDIIIPILFVDFQFDSYTLCNGSEVRRLTEKEHLARYNIKSYNVSVHDAVLSSATHALVLKNWEVENSPYTMDFYTLYKIMAYPIDQINNFFAALRLAENITTGYAQVFSLAKSWINYCKADLPCVAGTTVRSYPAIFEDYYWNTDPLPSITKNKMVTISKLFDLLNNSEKKSIKLSVKRLNQCLIRDNEEDSVLDATIALEALLSDNSNQEMTHKLAMRVGALVNLDSSFEKSPQQAFNDIKSIYNHRSAIVHGSTKTDTKRIVKLADNKETTTPSLAVDYLRFVLKVLLENPKYQNSKMIDSELLLGKANA